MAKKVAATLARNGFPDVRVTFERVAAKSADPVTGENVSEEMVVVTTRDASYGVYYLSRYGEDFNRQWVRDFVADTPWLSLVKFS